MKEVTYEDWQKNPTPRMMWVWDSKVEDKVKRKVIYFLNPKLNYPVVALTEEETIAANYRHCAEIEEQRRMTNKELSRWIREKPTREYKYITNDYICHNYDYREPNQDIEVYKDILIREDDGEWREPLMEVEE